MPNLDIILPIRCPVLNEGNKDAPKEAILEFEEGQPEMIICPNFSSKDKNCALRSDMCIYSKGWKEL